MDLINIYKELQGLTLKQLLMVKELNKKLIKAVIADIPKLISAEVGFAVKTVKLKKQLEDKWVKGKDLI